MTLTNCQPAKTPILSVQGQSKVEGQSPQALAQTQTLPPGVIPAFPGAEGFGATSVGGRGGRVIEVTTLADSGPGSLRAALEAKGPRLVVFRVAGIIELQDAIRIQHPYLTVAGQTAPGGGILLKGVDNGLLRLRKGVHDVVIRYLRLRNGSGQTDGSGYDNIRITGAHNVVVDHVSMSWSTDENASMFRRPDYQPIYNITIQRSIMAEGLAGHSNGLLIAGQADYRDPNNIQEAWRSIYNISIHHNLFAHNTHRNPRVNSAGTQVINNVIYNWKYRIGMTTHGSVIDVINNYAKAGPMSNLNRLFIHEPRHSKDLGAPYPDPSIYTIGNIVTPVHLNPAADNWKLWQLKKVYSSLPLFYRRYTLLPLPTIPVHRQSALQAYQSVLADVGANARLDCFGNWTTNLDPVDTRVLNQTQNTTGPSEPINNPSDVGGYPDLDPGIPCQDQDQDGMPDAWEALRGFNPNDPNDGSLDIDGDGYTNIEEYLNGNFS